MIAVVVVPYSSRFLLCLAGDDPSSYVHIAVLDGLPPIWVVLIHNLQNCPLFEF